ncbi:hypothetical protein [Phytohabitans aurantiacus]|uniref:Uncharacterized protein n=1 Tax=Phytohabitans aurantiacus TaxID=3016789 RepID=A0ABQ5R2J1_9ACTN|nr:hypothetical protein [Phytohabitans aurantiacus]GLI00776.1 hypothetical protein Pa4123_60520 [Phytohabitans aurantiacus]
MSYAVRPLPVGILVLTAALAGCGGSPEASSPSPTPPATTAVVDAATTEPARQPHTLVLTATGKATIVSFTYTLDGKATEGGSAKLPWRVSVDVPADGKRHEWSLRITYRKGNVDLMAMFNGKVQTSSRGASSGEGTGGISGSVLG